MHCRYGFSRDDPTRNVTALTRARVRVASTRAHGRHALGRHVHVDAGARTRARPPAAARPLHPRARPGTEPPPPRNRASPLATRGSTVPARARPRPAAFASREDRRDAASRPRPRAKAASATAGVGSAAATTTKSSTGREPRRRRRRDAFELDLDAIEPVPSGSSATPPNGQMFVDFFRQASPYIANHRGATFVVHVPGSVMADPDRAILEGIVQDIAMLNSLGARVAVVVGSNEQVSAMCARRSVPVEVVDGYRVTTPESLEIAMEAAGRNDVLVQALLSRA